LAVEKELNSSSGNRGVQFTHFNIVNEYLNAPVETKGSFLPATIFFSIFVNKRVNACED